MYKKAYSLGLVGLSCVLSFSAQANNFNYNFFEVRTAISPESSGAEFSTYLTDNTHLVARYDSRFDGDWDAAGGIGFNGPISQFADVYGQVLIHHIRPTDEQGGKSETQLEFNIGSRIWLSSQIEANIKLGKNDEHSVFCAGLLFHSTEQLSLGAETKNNGVYGSQIVMNVRFQF